MANVKNFSLIGVGSDVQYGKTGPRIKHTTGTFQFRNATDAGDAALTAAGITSSAGNVTLTTGNVVLSSNSGVVTLGDAGSLGRAAAGVYSLSGTGGIIMPIGTSAQQPDPTLYPGAFRYNSDTGQMEYANGTVWNTLATGGAAVTAISIATANGFQGSSSGGTTPTLTLETTVSGLMAGSAGDLITAVSGTHIKTVGGNSLVGAGEALTTALGPTYGGTGVSTFASGSVLYASGADTWAVALPGSTSGVQAWDADLDALAGLGSTGFAVRIAADTWAQRSITGTAGRIVVTNGDGVASSPSIDLDTLTDDNTGTFVKITRDSYGRVQGTTAVVQGDITGLVDSVYVNVAGDTMTGNLDFGGTQKVTGLAAPTNPGDATNKAYVDAATTGFSWKTAVLVASTDDLDTETGATWTYDNGVSGVGATLTSTANTATLDGVALVNGARVLVLEQTDAFENGIYVTSGVGGAAVVLTRTTDADTPAELDGAAVFVQQGTVNGDTGWVQTNTIVTVGTTAVNWSQFSGGAVYVGGTGIDITGNTISANLGAGIVELPTDEIGIHLFDPATGALILTTDGTARSTATGASLHLLLDAAGALAQGVNGLRVNAASVTNAMLVNNFITLDADTGTSENVALGATMLIAGDSAQGVSTAVSATNTVTITVQDATTALKGVASFDSANFTVTSGAVSLAAGGVDLTTDVTGILPVANGGTGASSLTATAVLLGNGTSPITTDALLTFVTATNTLTVGTSTISAVDGGDLTITATATDADIVLVPNGTGSVVIGPAGAGQISSDSGQGLTVTGDTFLTLVSTTGDVTIDSADDLLIDLPNTTTAKVSLTTVTAVNYATGLADGDLVNKYYVDTVAGSASGDVKAVKATFSLAAAGTFNIGSALPAGATVLSVKANVTSADTGTGTLSVGKAGDVAAYMTTSENDTQSVGMYLAETMVTEASSEQVIGTVAGTPAGAGSVTVVVTYQIA
jgi:hypothetical protein